MNANEFNDLTAEIIEEQLASLGFRQQTVHFFIHRPPNIMVLHKKTSRGSFDGFYLALTHDFMSNVIRKKEKLKVPAFLEEYPFSIALAELTNQYAKHKSARDFSYDTNFLTREVLPNRRTSKKDPFSILGFQSLQRNEGQAQEYVKSTIDIVRTDGMKLLEEYSPEISYLSVTRFKGVNDFTLNKFKGELEKYFEENNIDIPRKKKGWFGRLFGE